MPLVRIDLGRREPAATVRAITDEVHSALIATIDVPPDDRFQIVTVHDPGGVMTDAKYLGIERSDAAVIVSITLRAGRSDAKKQALYRQIATNLTHAGVRAQTARRAGVSDRNLRQRAAHSRRRRNLAPGRRQSPRRQDAPR